MKITIEEGPDRGNAAEVTDDVFTIGRDPGCTLVLTDPQASSRHAAIETAIDGSVVLRDLRSTNGTFLDGRRLEGAVAITGNELVGIGQNALRLSLPAVDRTVVRPIAAADTKPRDVPAAFQQRPAPAASRVEQPSPPVGVPAQAGARDGPRRRPNGKVLVGIGAVLVVAIAAVAVIVLSGSSSTLTPEQLIARATPSVVRIEGDQGAGSGVVIDLKREYVLTNAHVVVGNSALKAQVGNSTGTVPVRLIAASPCDDLAVVKLVNPVPNLKALPLGVSASLRPGDQVTVLGFPGSFQTSVGSQQTGLQQASTVVANTGSVSQVNVQGAPDPSLPTYQNLIVHQAPTNHGNSGGPLLNQHGQVVGINTLANPDTQGQYYSIAIDYVKRLLPSLEAGISRGLIGWDLLPLSANDANLVQELQGLYSNDPPYDSDAARLASDTARFLQANPPTTGMYDGADQPGSAADKAGTAGFLIDKINGNRVSKLQDVCDIVNSASPGQVLRIHNYKIDAGSDPTQLSAELALAGQSPGYTTDLKVPGN